MRYVRITLHFLFILSLFAGATVPGQAGWLGEHNVVRCAKLLLQRRREHHVPSESAEVTRAALRRLHLLRASALSDFSFAPGNEPVIASHDSSRRARQTVARRVSALLDEGRVSEESEDAAGLPTATSQILVATEIVGAGRIRKELNMRRVIERRMARDLAFDMNLEAINAHVGLPLIGAAETSLITLFPSFPHPILAAMLAYARHMPEMAVRGWARLHYGRRQESRLAEHVSDPKPGEWIYSSVDVELPEPVVGSIWSRGFVTEEDLRKYWVNLVRPRWTESLTGIRFSAISGRHALDQYTTQWLRVDEWLAFDPWLGKPVLISALRIVDTLPAYPTTQSERADAVAPRGVEATSR